jgi:molybdopterin molybdotransferase
METVRIENAARRFLAGDVVSAIDLPRFDNSAMDGYAVRAADLAVAAPDSPVSLRVLGEIAAGDSPVAEVTPGTCLRIFTGSPLPLGADAVVMQEDTRLAADGVLVLDAARPFENVRLRGEDLKQGETIASRGCRLTAARLAVIAASGVAEVRVARRPVVALLSTGSELCEPGSPLAPGRIFESNRLALAALVAEAGGDPRSHPLVPDTVEATARALSLAFDESDLVVTTGGVSVGEHDCVKAAFERLGGSLDFWKISLRPGKPFAFGERGGRLLFGLPGNPVSAFVSFLLLVRMAILKAQGAASPFLPLVPGILRGAISNPGERRHFVRVRMDDDGSVRSAGAQSSHMLLSLSHANGLLDVPARATLDDGEPVRVLRWDLAS